MALILPANWCLIFFKDPDEKFTTAQMQLSLKKSGLSVSNEAEVLSVRWGDGPILKVSIQRGSHLEAVLRGLVGQHRKYSSFISGVDAEIKIEISDLNEALDEINTLIEVQATLQDVTQGLMYMSWNQVFSPPSLAVESKKEP